MTPLVAAIENAAMWHGMGQPARARRWELRIMQITGVQPAPKAPPASPDIAAKREAAEGLRKTILDALKCEMTTRELATALGMNRKTVFNGLLDLEADGHVMRGGIASMIKWERVQ